MLGIFRTKKAQNNKLILKSLATGPKTTTQIAEYIYLNRSAVPLKKLNKNEVKTLVSIISRKDSRLDELEAKDYIFQENNLWQLTTKGLSVALTQFNSIMEVFPYIDLGSSFETIQKQLYELPIIELIFKTSVKREIFDGVFNFGKSPEYLQFVKDFTNELIAKGVDLDNTGNDEFVALLIGKLIVVLPGFMAKIVEKREGV